MLTLMRTSNDFKEKGGFNNCVVDAGSQLKSPWSQAG